MTINKIFKEFEVYPNQIPKWKKLFLLFLLQIFDNSKTIRIARNEELTIKLFQQIGQLKVELDWGIGFANLSFSGKVRRWFVEPENKRKSWKNLTTQHWDGSIKVAKKLSLVEY